MTTMFGDISPRTGAYAAKELLKRGLPYLVLEKFGQAKELPGNSTKTIKFRRYNALDNTPVALVEGVTPASQSLTVTDVSITLTQYGGLITISDVVQDTHEDPVLNESVTLLGEQAAQVVERVRYGTLRAGVNVLIANGVSRNAINTPVSISVQRRAVRALKRQNARPITRIIRSTAAFGSETVAPGFVALIHPDLESDVRNLPGFVPAEKYGTMTPWENELGKCEDVRYVSSTIFAPFADAGGAKAGASGTCLSTSGTNADVYPILYLGQDAYGIVALKGGYAITPTVVNPKPSDSDPLGQRGHAGWKTMQGAVIH
ncbi:MAG TPA: N4-gp56 family major capsid protein [Rhodanobacteraceae bacterium]|nr:N4-gp56 family major capsid protein [Rhodanobacteraceae bacterium]